MFNLKDKKDFIYVFFILFVILTAVILRIVVYFDVKPLWHDEAPVALTVMNNTFDSVLKNITDYQKAPPLFWLTTKFFGYFGNYNEISLRFFPFLCSLASVFVFYFLSKEILNKRISIVIANFLFAVNYRLIYYAQELKQYSSDVLFFCIALIFFGKMIDKPFNLKNLVICLLFSSIIILFSLPSFFVIGGFILYKIFLFIKKKKINVSSKQVPYSAAGSSICSESGNEIKPHCFLLFNIIFACISFWYYNKFFANIYNIEIMYLSDYWDSGFLNFSNCFLILKSLFSYFLYPNATFVFELIVFLIGFIFFFTDKKHITKLILFSFFLIAAASSLKLYPLYERVALYLIPAIIVIIVKSFDLLKPNPLKIAGLFVLFILSVPVYLFPQYYINFFHKNIFTVFDGRETLNFIKSEYNSKQKILINRASLRIFEYYKRQLNFDGENYEIFDYRKINKDEFFKYLDKNKNGQTWIYYVFTGKDNQERIWLDEWRDKNKDYVKSELVKNKSYILKI